MWLQQVPSLIYLVAGAFLFYLYWKRLHRRSVLVCGVLFVLYSIYRFFLVRRSFRRSGLGS
jgi:Na+/proline symporter